MKISRIVNVALSLFRRKKQPHPLTGVQWELLPYRFEIDWCVDASGELMVVRETVHLSGNAVRQSLTYRRNR